MPADGREDISLELFDALERIPVQGYDAQRRVVYWNQASELVYGYSREEAMGRRLEDLIIPEEMRQEVVAAVRRWAEEGVPIPSGDLVLRHKDGSPVHVFSSHVMRTNQRGEPEMFCVDIDVTERRRAEQATARALAEKEALLKELQHRVKNNMQVFKSLLAMQAREEPDPGAARALAKMQGRVSAMSLAHDLVAGEGSPAKVELSDYLHRLTGQLAAAAPAGGPRPRISLTVPRGLELALDRTAALGLAVGELVANALQHAFPQREEGRVEVRAAAGPEGGLAVVVSDDGVGLPPGLDWRRGGGLGLALARGLVEDQLRGGLRAASRPGRGAEFTIEVPA
jgi:PAS domain S-box-containing protein